MEPKKEPPKDDPNSITNILALVISILDWLKTAGKSKQDLGCPELCEVNNAVERLREMNGQLGNVNESKYCACDEKEADPKPEIKIRCTGGENDGPCNDPKCEKCEQIRKGKKREPEDITIPAIIVKEIVEKSSEPPKNDSTNEPTKEPIKESTKKVGIMNESPPQEMLEIQEKEDGECPVLKWLFTRCDTCCQVSSSKEAIKEQPPKVDQNKEQVKSKKSDEKICVCKDLKGKQVVITNTQMNQSNIETDEKKVQAQQFKIMYEQRKAVLNSLCTAARQENYRNIRSDPVTRGRGTYRPLDLPPYTSEDEGEDDDEFSCYDCIRPPSPKSFGPPRQTLQQPIPPPYRGYYPPPYYPPLSYQSTRIPQRNGYNARSGNPYQSYRPCPYQELRCPLASEGARNPPSPPRCRIPLYGSHLKSSLNEKGSADISRDITPTGGGTPSSPPSKTRYSAPEDCAKRLIEAIMKNPSCPAYEALKEATKVNISVDISHDISQDSQNETEDEASTDIESRASRRSTSSVGCDEDCIGSPKKKLRPPGKRPIL